MKLPHALLRNQLVNIFKFDTCSISNISVNRHHNELHTHTPTICLHPRRLRRNMECLTYWRLFWLVLNIAVVNDAQNNLYRTKRGSKGNSQQPARPDQTWPGVVVVAFNIPGHSLTKTCLLHHNNKKTHPNAMHNNSTSFFYLLIFCRSNNSHAHAYRHRQHIIFRSHLWMHLEKCPSISIR